MRERRQTFPIVQRRGKGFPVSFAGNRGRGRRCSSEISRMRGGASRAKNRPRMTWHTTLATQRTRNLGTPRLNQSIRAAARRVSPEIRSLNGRTGGEGEAPAEPQAERTGPVCSTGSRGSAPAREQMATIGAESSRRGSAGASPSRKNHAISFRRDSPGNRGRDRGQAPFRGDDNSGCSPSLPYHEMVPDPRVQRSVPGPHPASPTPRACPVRKASP